MNWQWSLRMKRKLSGDNQSILNCEVLTEGTDSSEVYLLDRAIRNLWGDRNSERSERAYKTTICTSVIVILLSSCFSETSQRKKSGIRMLQLVFELQRNTDKIHTMCRQDHLQTVSCILGARKLKCHNQACGTTAKNSDRNFGSRGMIILLYVRICIKCVIQSFWPCLFTQQGPSSRKKHVSAEGSGFVV